MQADQYQAAVPLSGRVERAAPPPDTMCSRTVSASELSNSGTRREIIQWSEHGGDRGWLDQRQAPLHGSRSGRVLLLLRASSSGPAAVGPTVSAARAGRILHARCTVGARPTFSEAGTAAATTAEQRGGSTACGRCALAANASVSSSVGLGHAAAAGGGVLVRTPSGLLRVGLDRSTAAAARSRSAAAAPGGDRAATPGAFAAGQTARCPPHSILCRCQRPAGR